MVTLKYRRVHISLEMTSCFDAKFLQSSTYSTMSLLTKHSKKIGTGTYSYVYEGRTTANVRTAVKIYISWADKLIEEGEGQESFSSSDFEESYIHMREEALVLSKLKHRNVIQIFGTCTISNRGAIVMPLMKTNLGVLMGNGIDAKGIAKIVPQIVSSLRYIHSKGVVHGDIKENNFLVSSSGTVKLCDFGLSEGDYDVYYIERHRSPRLRITGGKPLMEDDIWAMGCMVYKMVTGKPFIDLQLSSDDLCNWVIESDDMVPIISTDSVPTLTLRELLSGDNDFKPKGISLPRCDELETLLTGSLNYIKPSLMEL